MKTRAAFLILLALFVAGPTRADKTDLAKEVYVEASDTDFTITVKSSGGAKDNVRVFEVSGPQSGEHTLLCFVDGRYWSKEKVNLPTKYSLSVRGLTPGDHKITLQVVDKDGRVGSQRQSFTKDK